MAGPGGPGRRASFLTEEEKQEIRLDWTRKSLNRVRTFENKFYEMYPEFK